MLEDDIKSEIRYVIADSDIKYSKSPSSSDDEFIFIIYKLSFFYIHALTYSILNHSLDRLSSPLKEPGTKTDPLMSSVFDVGI